MPNISSLTMPDGIVYSIKDSIARKEIEEIKKNGSGSGESSGAFIVVASEDENHVITVDKTLAEIVDAYDENKVVITRIAQANSLICINMPLISATSEIALFASITYFGGATATLLSLAIPATGSASLTQKTVELAS